MRNTSFSGRARNAKAGAVLVSADQNLSYVKGLHEWPDILDGQQVIVVGTMGEEQHVATATQDESGAWSQGKTDSVADSVITSECWMPAAPWSVQFCDGSGNITTINAEASAAAASITWNYDPVTEASSSSGTYSGGESAQGETSIAAAAGLWIALIAILEAREEHTEARAMGTGMFTVVTALGERRLIVKESCLLAAFGSVLAAMRETAP